MQADQTIKRKRGRPSASNASKQSETAPTEPELEPAPELRPEQDGAADEAESRPRKRGRPSKNNTQPETGDSEARPARGRTTTTTARQSLDNTVTNKEDSKRKRGRDIGQEQAGEGETAVTKKTKTKTLRVSKARIENAAAKEAEEQPGSHAKPSRPRAGRPALQEKTLSEAQNNVADASGQGKRRRGRPSGVAAAAAAETEAAPPSLPKKKRGRPSKGGDTEPPLQQNANAQADNDEEVTAPAAAAEPRSSTQRSGKREAPLPPKRYLHVAPYVRGVKQATIDAKWTPLNTPSIAIASEILELAHRPIIQRMSSTARRRQHTSAALSVAYRRITRKLQRGLPFPPAGMPSSASAARGGDGGRETELDFESVLDGKRALERQLDPALHAVELLKREKSKMVRELERDYLTLRNLEAGARTQAREQREKLKRAHVLAPEASGRPHLEDVEMIFDDDDGTISQGNTFKVGILHFPSFRGIHRLFLYGKPE